MKNELLNSFLEGVRDYKNSYTHVLLYSGETRNPAYYSVKLINRAKELTEHADYKLLGYLYSDILLNLASCIASQKIYIDAIDLLSKQNDACLDYYGQMKIKKEFFALQEAILAFDNRRLIDMNDVKSFVEECIPHIYYLFIFAEQDQIKEEYSAAVDQVIRMVIESLMHLLSAEAYKNASLTTEDVRGLYLNAIAILYALLQTDINSDIKHSLMQYKGLLEEDFKSLSGYSVDPSQLAKVINLSNRDDFHCFLNCSKLQNYTTYLLEYPQGIFHDWAVYTDATMRLIPEVKLWVDSFRTRNFGYYSLKYPNGLFNDLDRYLLQRLC